MAKAKPKPKTARRKASLADRICEAVKALTPERRGWGLRYVSVSDVAQRLGVDDPDLIDAAVQELVEQGRLKAGGNPAHSVALLSGHDQ